MVEQSWIQSAQTWAALGLLADEISLIVASYAPQTEQDRSDVAADLAYCEAMSEELDAVNSSAQGAL